MLHKAFKYQFYPTPEQEGTLSQPFEFTRFVYNKLLGIRWSGPLPDGFLQVNCVPPVDSDIGRCCYTIEVGSALGVGLDMVGMRTLLSI